MRRHKKEQEPPPPPLIAFLNQFQPGQPVRVTGVDLTGHFSFANEPGILDNPTREGIRVWFPHRELAPDIPLLLEFCAWDVAIQPGEKQKSWWQRKRIVNRL